MSQWISLKDEFPKKDVVVYVYRGWWVFLRYGREKVMFRGWQWIYPSGLGAYQIHRNDMWKPLDEP